MTAPANGFLGRFQCVGKLCCGFDISPDASVYIHIQSISLDVRIWKLAWTHHIHHASGYVHKRPHECASGFGTARDVQRHIADLGRIRWGSHNGLQPLDSSCC